MATDSGKLYNKKKTIKPIICKRDVSRGVSKGFTIAFLNDPDFRAAQLEHDRDEEVCI